jgi:hypothetical protein
MGLSELRSMLPPPIPIWAGGASVERMRRAIDDIALIRGLQPVIDKIKAWRTLHASA